MDSSQVSMKATVFRTREDGRKHAFSVAPSVEGQGQNKQETGGEAKSQFLKE